MKDFYRLHHQTGVWVPNNTSTDPLTQIDGISASDQEILEILEAVQDRSLFSPELLRKIHDWPTECHLGSDRANLLRPFESHLRGRRVLEVGCGCGALTRYLGEAGADVTAVDANATRCRIAATRCRDLTNVRVYWETIEGLRIRRLFDVVVLVGVLEHSPTFGVSKDPVGVVLRRCAELLRPNGLLLIAIENQLGLKYFAGGAEDHVMKPFYGLQDLYREREAITFGRLELERRVQAAGFSVVEFYFPFPDYKRAKVIVHEAALRESWLDVGEIVRRYPAYDQGLPYERLFSEEAAWGVISRNGLIGDLSNSFLVAARKRSGTSLVNTTGLVSIYSTHRAKSFAKVSIINSSEEGPRVLSKKLYPEQPDPPGPVRQQLGCEEYVEGALYISELYRIVNRSEWSVDTIHPWANPWVSFVESVAKIEGGDFGGHTKRLVPASFLDCTPANTIISRDGSFRTIDLEWVWEADLPLEFVLFRGLFWSLADATRTCAQPRFGTPLRILDLTISVLAACGWSVNDTLAEKFLTQEAIFQAIATGRDRASIMRSLQNQAACPRGFNNFLSYRIGRELTELEHEVSRKDELIRSQSRMVEERDALIRKLEETIREQQGVIEEKDQLIASQARMVEERDALIQRHESMLAEDRRLIEEKCELIAKQDRMIIERDLVIANQDHLIEERDRYIQALEMRVSRQFAKTSEG